MAATRPAYISIRMDHDRSLVYSTWLRAVNSHEYRVAINHFSQIIEASKACYWLADITRLTAPTMYDQKWTANFLVGLFQGSHLKKIAVVVKSDLFMEVVLERIGEEVSRNSHTHVPLAIFDNTAEADSWLANNHDVEGLFREDAMNG